jgi:predicted nucleic acid-binding protein
MRLYLDLCCLKRPFDDQSQTRVASETAAVVRLLTTAERGEHVVLLSAAHLIENSRDPDDERRAAVQIWFDRLPPPGASTKELDARFSIHRAAGFGQVDALHLAWAEVLGADRFVTTDDRLIRRAARLAHTISVRVINPVPLVQEIDHEHHQ